MRNIATLILYFFAITFICKAQDTLNGLPPIIFLDSVRVDLTKTYLNVQNIKDIHVVIVSDSINGNIYITSNDPNHSFLTLADMIKQSNLKGSIVLFIIDDKIINDTTKIRIDSSVIKKVTVTKSSDVKYWDKNIPPINILNIETILTETKDKKAQQIRLR
jgi:hypothetical protein